MKVDLTIKWSRRIKITMNDKDGDGINANRNGKKNLID